MAVIPATWETEIARIVVQSQANNSGDPISKITRARQEPVAHACNPSYSGGRDQEECSSKAAWANSSRDPILKETLHKKG
jgi:hypothetical protein